MTNRFSERLYFEFIGSDMWRLVEPFHYDIGYEYSGHRITIPKGFETNLITVWPRWLARWISPRTPGAKAAIIHDFLYNEGKRSQKACDDIFLEAMKVERVPFFRRYFMYYAVRIFGHRHYGGNNANSSSS